MTTIKIYRIGIIICLSLLIASGSVLGQSFTTRSKQVKKSYNLTKKTRLAIDNKYGDVHINTWDQNRMEVTVTIKAEKRSEDRAQQLLEQVEIEINGNESTGTIEFETHIRGNHSGIVGN